MYIEYTSQPLEEQLYHILKDPVAAAALLAEAGLSGERRLTPPPPPVQTQTIQNDLFEDEPDGEDEEYEYVLRKVPRLAAKQRATPDLIPAAHFLGGIGCGTAAAYLHPGGGSEHRQQLPNGYGSITEEIEIVGARSSSRCSSFGNSQQGNSTLPMGLDIIAKIRKYLNFGQSRVDDHEPLDCNRKRRSEGNCHASSQIKYRKVDNQFPKIITRPLIEDDLEFLPNTLGSLNTTNHHYGIKNQSSNSPLTMSQQRKYLQEKQQAAAAGKQQRRNSLFVQPPTVRKHVTNTAYADVEFSDDDDGEIIGSININGIGGASGSAGSNVNFIRGIGTTPALSTTARQTNSAKVCNIPIRYVDQHFEKMAVASKPPPPLIEARTGGFLASSLLPELRTIRQPTYADILRQNGHASGAQSSRAFQFGGQQQHQYRSGAIASNLAAAAAAAAKERSSSSRSTSAIYNGGPMLKSNNPFSRSIIAKEQEIKEREQYRELIDRMVPRYCGIDDTSMKGLYNSSSSTSASAQKKRNSLLVADQNAAAAAAAGAARRKSSHQLRPPPKIITTISLTDDEDIDDVILSNENDDANIATIIDDDDISEIIDLDENERNMLSTCTKLNKLDVCNYDLKKREVERKNQLPYVEPINTLKEKFDLSPVCNPDWMKNFKTRWEQKEKERNQAIAEISKEVEELSAERHKAEKVIQERLRDFQIIDPEFVVIDEFPEDLEYDSVEEEAEEEIFEFTPEQQKRIQVAISGPRNEVLITKFSMSISRRDVETLLNLSWLNDEVINFYMNLLMERSEKRHKSDGLPLVYAQNTFFVPRLMEGGHAAVRRWTRKVNIFERDIIPVPVHVGGVHWCMAIIHLKNKSIKYYDSMGTPNPKVLAALAKYLQDESMDKLKKPFDTSGFEIESVSEVPRQMNGSDCGVFSCMFAEYITRNREITFSQEHMQYFRHKMILEIVQGELLL